MIDGKDINPIEQELMLLHEAVMIRLTLQDFQR